VKYPTGSNSTGAAHDSESAAVVRKESRWAREVLRRGTLEFLYLGSNLAIAGCGLLWLYRLLTHKPAFQAGLCLAAAVGVSLFTYHFARWRASPAMSRQVEKLTPLLITLGMALVWGAICIAITFGVLRWFTASGSASWIIAAAAGAAGFTFMVAGEWSEIGDCLTLPAAANQNRHTDESAA
jgi:hypothetical protein